MIQKIWRGHYIHNKFINELNILNHKIQITKNKIANQDPKFWNNNYINSNYNGNSNNNNEESNNNSILKA